MRKETELFFAAHRARGPQHAGFLDADYTFVNERLAKHYGFAA